MNVWEIGKILFINPFILRDVLQKMYPCITLCSICHACIKLLSIHLHSLGSSQVFKS